MTFDTSDFRRFIGGLEYLDLKILGFEDDENQSCPLTYPGYAMFLREYLNNVFFRHMHALQHLEIHASCHAPLGWAGQWYSPLPLEPEYCLAVRSLTLAYCFVGSDLVDFLHSHAQVLTSLDIADCVCAADDTEGAEMDWARFFDQVYESKPVLTNLVVGNPDVMIAGCLREIEVTPEQITAADRMPGPRSRQGCTECRRRRRKCDEAKPICGQCSTYSRACIYAFKVVWSDGLRSNRAPLDHRPQPRELVAEEAVPAPPVHETHGTLPRCLPNGVPVSPKYHRLLNYFTNDILASLSCHPSVHDDLCRGLIPATLHSPQLLSACLALSAAGILSRGYPR
ncbi:uncharacterized protein PG998_006531 [Apiospora kogelbergensis]|uniref:uncharacterized protein n=1 Tax=Apiospora kogelbergensis TaxID=1337665 RepID=UPI00312E5CCC